MKIKSIISCGLMCVSMVSVGQELDKSTKASRARICSVVLTEAMNSAAFFAGDSVDKKEKNDMINAANIFLSAKNYWDMVFLAEGTQGKISKNEYEDIENAVQGLYSEDGALRILTKESAEFCVDKAEGTEL